MSVLTDSASIESIPDTQTTVADVLQGRNIDRVLAYIKMKMDVALATNSELSAIRAQVLQMGSFLTVALVLGTGGVHSFLDWDRTILALSLSVTIVVVLLAYQGIRVSSRYTDMIMDEYHAFETLYSLIVWENVNDIDAIAKEVCEIEQSTRKVIDTENRKHPLLVGTILHTMMHYERHSPFHEDIGTMTHRLPMTDADGHC